MKTIKDYHNLYLKCDVLLLADVFEKFRNNSLNNYGLCPSQCLKTPRLKWNVILKKKKAVFELILDPGMYIFFKKLTRGGVTYVCNGHSKSSLKYLKSYNPKQELTHIIYLYT